MTHLVELSVYQALNEGPVNAIYNIIFICLLPT